MRTTVDISEPLLRQAKARAALEGKKLKDVVNEALEDLLSVGSTTNDPKTKLPKNIRIDTVGKFRIPVIQSSRPGKANITPKDLKDLEFNEDAATYGTKK